MSRMRKFWLSVGLILAGLVGLSAVTTWSRDVLQLPLIRNEAARPSDVIIVLGSGTRKRGDHLPPQAKQRILAGLLAYRQGFAPQLIMSGGRDRNTGLTESVEMLAYAERKNQPATTIILEAKSKDTWQNALYSTAIMKQRQWQTALVVTSPYHTWRACRMFRKQGADVRCLAAPFSLVPANSIYERLMDTRSVIREYGAIVYNWLKGQL